MLMATRLLASCRAQGRPWLDCHDSLRAYDLDAVALRQCRRKLAAVLERTGVPDPEAAVLLNAWLSFLIYLGCPFSVSQLDPVTSICYLVSLSVVFACLCQSFKYRLLIIRRFLGGTFAFDELPKPGLSGNSCEMLIGPGIIR